MKPLEVDGFEIDITILNSATVGGFVTDYARYAIVEKVIENLTQESKERFEEYQKQNDPCI